MDSRNDLTTTYLVEGALSFAANLLFVGIFFYTSRIFHWTLVQNFLLASAQGATYIVASLASEKLAHALGRRALLLAANLTMIAIALTGVLSNNQLILTAVIIAAVPMIGLNWPILESQSVAGADPHQMSRRIGAYNLVWSFTAALAVALQGTLISIHPKSVFFIPLIIHLFIVITLLIQKSYGQPQSAIANPKSAMRNPQSAIANPQSAILLPEPALQAQRTQALWLSRITLPSTYVVLYSLSALMPLLPVIKSLSPAAQTPIGSIWLATRFIAFGLLGATTFWHTRPRLLLYASLAMAVAFAGITLYPKTLPHPFPIMILSQSILGLAIGTIYTASLYFGLALSQGSAAHAGYHEALIGAGQLLGPGIGALTQTLYPNNTTAGGLAVTIIIALSIATAWAKARQPAIT